MRIRATGAELCEYQGGFFFFIALLNNWSQIVFVIFIFIFFSYNIKAMPEMKYQWGEEKRFGKKNRALLQAWLSSPGSQKFSVALV